MANVTRAEVEKALRLVSKAWGKQSGYAFFPTISGKATDKRERIESYREGPAFLWPRDRDLVVDHILSHTEDDVYWCPSLFEKKRRQLEFAMDEHALWADLDTVDPRGIEDYPPTIAWQTSPGRYQALWIVRGGDIQGASWPGRENQALTYYLDADPSGWDSTQLLRLPGWPNYKPEYRAEYGKAPKGELLWATGRTYLPDEFNDLPDVPAAGQIAQVLEDEVDRVDRHEVWGRVRLKVSKEVRELVSTREAVGDRSDKLWQIERDLADAGCSVAEIVSVVRETVWNKFRGRADELRRLVTEASKAVAQRPEKVKANLEEERALKPPPTNLFELVRHITVPKWLVKGVLSEGACGFIAGQPKSFKSWCGFDLALSVATGMDFLDYFTVMEPGPVLYIQEEDSLPMVKQRLDKIWPGKQRDKVVFADGELQWVPPTEYTKDEVPIDAYVGQGFTISDPGWQSWLDETLERGKYRLCLMDPLMMVAGDVEENRAQEMTEKLFKPIKQLARKHGTAMVFVHHMRKGDPRSPQRGGQLLLGSVANHAWAEDSLYIKLGRGGDVIVEQESKSAALPGFKITHIRNSRWEPQVLAERVVNDDGEVDVDESSSSNGHQPHGSVRRAQGNGHTPNSASRSAKVPKILGTLRELGPGVHSLNEIAAVAGVAQNTAYKQLLRCAEKGSIVKEGASWRLAK
jgi:hypothetical protein